jgi:hypothetical protein
MLILMALATSWFGYIVGSSVGAFSPAQYKHAKDIPEETAV